MKISLRSLLIFFILLIAFFLRVYKLNDLMPFIGDYAWFYISARDMILTGEIPLVGITSSHIWVHQGALWTYLLFLPLLASKFHPVSGAYLTAIAGTLSVFLMYKIGMQMFSRLVGLIAAALYATSPLVVIHSRVPYHTSLIPLFSLLFVFFIYKWIKGDVRFFPFVIFTLGILYNLELVTMIFWIFLILVFVYGVIKKEKWLRETLKFKTILLSAFLFLLVMFPMIIYDIKESSGFFQATAFFRIIKIYLFSPLPVLSFEEIRGIFASLFSYNQRLVFLGDGIFASILTVISFFYLLVRHSGDSERSVEDSRILVVHRDSGQARMTTGEKRVKNETLALLLLVLWIIISFSAILISGTASEAYVPMLFPAIIFSIALFLNYLSRQQAFIVLIVILFIAITNTNFLITKNYLMDVKGGYGLAFSKRLSITKEIINKAKGGEYNLVGKGKGSGHKTFTINYEYLAWWLGYPPSRIPEKLQFVIEEK